MSFIGRRPIAGNFQKCDAITTSSTATYNLTVSSVAVIPQSANHCIVSLNGVIQAPTSAFTVSGSTIVFNSSLTSSDVIDFILILGDVLDIGVPSDDAVSTAKIADDAVTTAKINNDAVTLAKMAAGTDGQIITYDASGNPAAVGPGTDGQVLTSTGAGSPPAFEAVSAGFTMSSVTASTSGSAVAFTGIPSTAKMIIINLQMVSLSGSDAIIFQLGDSGGVETSGYYNCSIEEDSGNQAMQLGTSGMLINSRSAAYGTSCQAIWTLLDSTNNIWMGSLSGTTTAAYGGDDSVQYTHFASCKKALSATLDRINVDTDGSDTFDAGSISIMYI